MQEELDQIIADLHRYATVQREVAMLVKFADFVHFGGQKAAELEEAGYHQQAVELRRRLAEMMPEATAAPPLGLPVAAHQVPAVSGVPPVPLARRRGRPSKSQSGGQTP